MNAPHPAHPTPDELEEFGLGKLDPHLSTTVQRHLETCSECREAVSSLAADSFLGRLRAAQVPGATPTPEKPVEGLAHNLAPPAPPNRGQPPGSLPAELANNQEYEVVRELGRGGMGVVYLVRNTLMGRDEVIKVMGREVMARPDAVDRFRREIQAAARLDHPNIVRAYFARLFGDLLVFGMEYVPGDELGALVKAHGPLPVGLACLYAQQVADGLQHAFEKGMAHRDVKPANMIRVADGPRHAVKILDFGLAKLTSEGRPDPVPAGGDGGAPGLTGDGRMLGTPDYMAPEQITDAQSADARADVYSLGCTLYFLLTGQLPFRAGSLRELLRQHREEEPRPLHLVRPEVPEELAGVVAKMMAKDPARRYQTPAEVAKALAPFARPDDRALPLGESPTALAGTTEDGSSALEEGRAETSDRVTLPVRSTVGPGPTPTPDRQSRRPRRVWSAAAAAGLVALFAALWAGGTLRVKTKDGVIVLENLPPDAVVLVDGDKVRLTWAADGKTAEIMVKPGRRVVVATRDGLKIAGETLEIDDGGRKVLTARYEPPAPPAELAPGPRPKPTPEPVRPGKKTGDPPKPPARPAPDKPLTLAGHTHFVWGVAFRPDGRRLVSGGQDGTVKLWDVTTGEHIRDLATGYARFTAVAWSPDGKYVAGSGDHPDIQVWDGKTGELVHTLMGHEAGVRCLAFNPGSSLLASGGYDRTAKVWDLSTGKDVLTFRGHTHFVFGVTFSPDGKSVASGSWDRTVKVWDAGSGAERHSLTGHQGDVLGVGFDRDGARLASSSQDGTVRVWDLTRGAEVRVLRGPFPMGRVFAAAYSPDGRLLAGGGDKRLALWDAKTGREAAVLTGHTASVFGLVFSRDGRWVATAGGDHTVKIWEVPDATKKRDKRFPVFRKTGDWAVDGDVIVQKSTNKPAMLLFGQPGWGDIDFSCEFFRGERWPGTSLVARARTLHEYYYFETAGFGNHLHDLEAYEPNAFRRLAVRPGTIDQHRWVPVGVRIRGTKFDCFVDGVFVLSGSDARRPSGFAGLRTFGGGNTFGRVVVTDPEGKILLEGLPDLP